MQFRTAILAFVPRLETESLDNKPRITLAAQEFPPEITARVRQRFPTVDVEVLEGGQSRYPLLLGLE